MKKIKVGLFLDSFMVESWFYEAIEKSLEIDSVVVDLVVINKATSKSLTKKLSIFKRKLVYMLFSKFDQKIFGNKQSAFVKKDIRKLLDKVDVLEVTPKESKFIDKFCTSDINSIKERKLDLIIRNGFRILKGDVLKSAAFGVWSYHHGDNRVNRGGPAGFWEWFKKDPETGAILQKLSEDLDGGQVLYRSWTKTNYLSPFQNKNSLYWLSSSFLCRALKLLDKDGCIESKVLDTKDEWYSGPLYRAPTNLKMIKVLLVYFSRIVQRIFFKLLMKNQWYLKVDLSGKAGKELRKFKSIYPPKDRFWADPFVIKENDKTYIFVEELLYDKGNAHLSVLELDEQYNIISNDKILDLGCHLSYPNVFKYEDKYYMIPESSELKTITLFEAEEFPLKWKKKIDLMTNIAAVDATVFRSGGLWWLFTSQSPSEGASYCDELFAYYSEDLFSQDWQPHELNPIVSDVKSARPAGNIYSDGNRLIRPSQDCSKIYGHQIIFNEILELTPSSYKEVSISKISPDWASEVLATHTINMSKGVTVVDAFRVKSRI